MNSETADVHFSPEKNTLFCLGTWTIKQLQQLALDPNLYNSHKRLLINGSALKAIDTAGAWQLLKFVKSLKDSGVEVELREFNRDQERLCKLINDNAKKILNFVFEEQQLTAIQQIGLLAYQCWHGIKNFLDFIGEFVITFLRALFRPKRLPWPALVNQVARTGYQAMPITALLCFLIGVVLAYQMGLQLHRYGADIWVVELAGMAILREFSPLIAAIIVCGRTASAYTAELGTMKMKQELDALHTLGLNPYKQLVLPRLLGLLIALPLLTFWANAFGVFGSMAMAKWSFHINFHSFLLRFRQEVDFNSYLLGLIKTPLFALIIATIGCFQGLQVSEQAESIGKQTTKSVVQAIFFIIIADAFFSILFAWYGI